MKWKKSEFRKLIKKYKYKRDIARHLGITRERVRQIINSLGLEKEIVPMPRRLYQVSMKSLDRNRKKQQRNMVIRRKYLEGATINKLAKEYDMCVIYIRRIVSSVKQLKQKKRDDKIYELYEQGMRQEDIAKSFKLVQSTVSLILKRKGK